MGLKLIKILETDCYFGGKYLKYRNNVLIAEVNIVTLKQKNAGFEYVLLADTTGAIIERAYHYLNVKLQYAQQSTREHATVALKIFYSFIELMDIVDYEQIGWAEHTQLTQFLFGGIISGNSLIMQLGKQRSRKTVNIYMGVYRDFFRTYVKDNRLFSEARLHKPTENYASTEFDKIMNVAGYQSNILIRKYRNEVPKFIKIDEYRKMLNIIDGDSKYTLRDNLIIRLMFERGLRIGEVLGITIEDILRHPTEDDCGLLALRNRVSDRKHQHAKGSMKVTSVNEYKSREYKTAGYGYQTVSLPPELFRLLGDYINESRNYFRMTDTAWKNLKKCCKADNVYDDGRENYYVFISKNYAPISKTGWNEIIKTLFTKIGLSLDEGVRRENLNHRFRHGYAMFLVEHMKYEDWEIQEELRHGSINTVKTYYNPTSDTRLKNSVEIENKMRAALEI